MVFEYWKQNLPLTTQVEYKQQQEVILSIGKYSLGSKPED